MLSELSILEKKICFSDSGKGKTIVLLHGYLESLMIWKEFAEELSQDFRIICFDIPGHGLSETIEEKHSMEMLAKRIYLALKELKVSNCFMIGHSMGGYLTLMFHQLFPELLSGFSLFHSHPFADTEEIKKKRLREIELIKDGKKDLIAKMNIPNAFDKNNLNKYDLIINETIDVALETPEAGIIANLHAMITRPDLSDSLSKTQIPFLYIAGRNDNYIDYNLIVPKIILPEKSQLHVLEHSGHMGFVEEKEISLSIIKNFINTF